MRVANSNFIHKAVIAYIHPRIEAGYWGIAGVLTIHVLFETLKEPVFLSLSYGQSNRCIGRHSEAGK